MLWYYGVILMPLIASIVLVLVLVLVLEATVLETSLLLGAHRKPYLGSGDSSPISYEHPFPKQLGGWQPPVKTCITNCGQTVPDTRVVYIDSLWELTSSLPNGTIVDPLWAVWAPLPLILG